uniref:Solute carrier family 22 member 31 n=1 Tax=Xenopus tropicalis TaxID=8364 RepID=A0A6I8Q6F7_XENTR
MEFDVRVWPRVGGFGRYTRLLAAATWLPNVALAMGFFSELMYTAVPSYQCQGVSGDPCPGNSSWENSSNQSQHCPGGWHFQAQGWLNSNIVTQWELLCDRQWKVPLEKISYLVGWLLGYIIFGCICDRLGRRAAFIGALVMALPLGVAVTFTSSYFSFLPLRAGFGAALAGMFLSFYISKSPRWLLATQQVEQCKSELHMFARANGINIGEDASGQDHVFTEIDSLCEGFPRPQYYSICSIFGTRLIWRNALILGFTAFIGCGIRPCFARNLQVFGPYIPYFLQAGSEIVACILICICVSHCGRRSVLLLFTILTGFCSLLLLALTQYLFIEASIVISVVGSLCSHAVVMLSVFYACEVLPTVIRGSGLGLIMGINMLGRASLPFIELQHKSGYFLYHVVLSSFCILSVLSLLLLPETKRKSLPETLRHGENLRRPPLLLHPTQDTLPLLKHGKKRADYNPDSYARLASSTKKMIRSDTTGSTCGEENKALSSD